MSDDEFVQKLSTMEENSDQVDVGDHEFELAVNQLVKLLGDTDLNNSKALEISNSRISHNLSKIGLQNMNSSVVDFKSYLESHSKNKEDSPKKDAVLGPVWESVAPSIKSRMQRSISAFREHLNQTEDPNETIYILNKINSEINEEKPKKEVGQEKWDELAQRLNRPYEKKAKKIEKIVNEREEDYCKNNTFQPVINERSRQLISPGSTLDDRVSTFVVEKMKHIEKKKQEFSKIEENELKFKPEITKKSQKMNRDVTVLLNWREEKKERLKSLKDQVKQKEVDGCTFRPNLSSRSRKIAEQTKKTPSTFQTSNDVFERNYEWEFIKNHKKRKYIESYIKQEKAQHNPNITSKASNLKRSEPFGDRLYKQGLEGLEKKEKFRETFLHNFYQKRGQGIIHKDDDSYFGDDDNISAGTSDSNFSLTDDQIFAIIKQYELDTDIPNTSWSPKKEVEPSPSKSPERENESDGPHISDPKERFARTLETLRLFHKYKNQKDPNDGDL
ncbi:predicted protein [Naegleria gruberi]|uniref:Predicted protein n=1 Tax=Naegleria gruberi TaxID=5762 RepID=D2UYG3_NAEGR|nr:uncharacterized protein NAEGRDRAFT_45170 [Naegleria gruberi]EFC50788.1 predicted protein [Naegleria gruberi]|eukprot:XP_002683532.1 predicted protein [Naegleria gruberi strain NEG-M]